MKKVFKLRSLVTAAALFTCLAVSTQSYGQNPAPPHYDSTRKLSPVNGDGIYWTGVGKFGGALILPYGIRQLAQKDSGAVSYHLGALWMFNGVEWSLIAGSGAGSFDTSTIYRVLDSLSNAKTYITFDPTYFRVDSPSVNNYTVTLIDKSTTGVDGLLYVDSINVVDSTVNIYPLIIFRRDGILDTIFTATGFALSSTSPGTQRIDVVYLDSLNVIRIETGTESADNFVAPDIPYNAYEITQVNIAEAVFTTTPVSTSGNFWRLGNNNLGNNADSTIGPSNARGFAIETNNIKRLTFDRFGNIFVPSLTRFSDTAANKVMTWNPTTKRWGYSYWVGGSGGTTPTLQQVLTAGNLLTKQDTINLQNFDLYFIGDSSSRVYNQISAGYLGGGMSTVLDKYSMLFSVNDLRTGVSHIPTLSLKSDSITLSVFKGTTGTPTNHFGMKYDYSYMDKPLYFRNDLGTSIQIDGSTFTDAPFIRVANNFDNVGLQMQPNAILFSDSSGLLKQTFILNGNTYDNQSSILYTPVNTVDTLAVGVEVNGVTYKTDTLGIVRLGTIGGGSSLFPTTGTGTATGNVTGSLAGNILSVVQGANEFLIIDPTVNAESVLLEAHNVTGSSNMASILNATSDQSASVNLTANFNGSAKVANIALESNSSSAIAYYTSDNHIFDGKLNLLTLSNGTSTDSLLVTNNTETKKIAASTFLTASNYVFNETPSGTINSSNVTFTLANTPIAGTVQVWVSGIRQKLTTHYSISGTTITFVTAPTTGSDLIVDYLK